MDPFDLYARFYDLDYAGYDDDLQLIQQTAARCGSPILELGCGTGRLLLPLAAEGFSVTGVDASGAMLEVARQKASAQGVDGRVTVIKQNMRELDLELRYRLAFAAINSFMHMMTTDDQLAALQGIRQHLTSDGVLLLDLFNPHPDRLLDCRGQVVLDKILTDPDTGLHWMKFITQTVDLAQQAVHTNLMLDQVSEEGRVQRTVFAYSLRYIHRVELELLLHRAGFYLEAIYGSYELDEFTGESDKMIAVARPLETNKKA
jgi:SAM-dependent methyltransferase